MNKIKLIELQELKEKQPTHHQVNGLDLVIIRYDDKVSVLYGRCLHRGALMADGHIAGDNLICGVHGWDYRFADTHPEDTEPYTNYIKELASGKFGFSWEKIKKVV